MINQFLKWTRSFYSWLLLVSILNHRAFISKCPREFLLSLTSPTFLVVFTLTLVRTKINPTSVFISNTYGQILQQTPHYLHLFLLASTTFICIHPISSSFIFIEVFLNLWIYNYPACIHSSAMNKIQFQSFIEVFLSLQIRIYFAHSDSDKFQHCFQKSSFILQLRFLSYLYFYLSYSAFSSGELERI